jgi:cell division septation protein DedD
MDRQDRDPFDDYEDEDEFLTFDARDEQTGSNRGPLIIAGVVVLLFLFAMVAWTLMSGRSPDAPSTEIAANDAVAEDVAAQGDVVPDASILDLEPEPPGLELEAIEGAEDPLVAAEEAAAPVAPAAAAPAPARAPAPAPRPATTVAPAPKPAPARAAEAPAPRPVAVAPRPAPAPTKTASATPAPRPAPAPTPRPAPSEEPAAPAASGAYQAQLGSFQTRSAAESQLARYRADGLVGAVSVTSADLGARGTWYRIRATGFENRAEAQEFCGKATAAGAPCIATSN